MKTCWVTKDEEVVLIPYEKMLDDFGDLIREIVFEVIPDVMEEEISVDRLKVIQEKSIDYLLSDDKTYFCVKIPVAKLVEVGVMASAE